MNDAVITLHVLGPFEHTNNPVVGLEVGLHPLLFDYLDDLANSKPRNACPWFDGIQIRFGSRNPGPEEGVNANPDDLDDGLALDDGEIVGICCSEFEAGQIFRELVGRVVLKDELFKLHLIILSTT